MDNLSVAMEFPNEISIQIFSHLSEDQRSAISRTSSLWRFLIYKINVKFTLEGFKNKGEAINTIYNHCSKLRNGIPQNKTIVITEGENTVGSLKCIYDEALGGFYISKIDVNNLDINDLEEKEKIVKSLGEINNKLKKNRNLQMEINLCYDVFKKLQKNPEKFHKIIMKVNNNEVGEFVGKYKKLKFDKAYIPKIKLEITNKSIGALTCDQLNRIEKEVNKKLIDFKKNKKSTIFAELFYFTLTRPVTYLVDRVITSPSKAGEF